MAKTEIDYEVMQGCINDLNSLITEHNKIIRPVLLGRGGSVSELERIADTYEVFDKALKELLVGTVVYLNKLVKNFGGVDETIATDINSGGNR